MDWPLTAAVGTLAVVVGAAGYGAVALIRMDTPQVQRPAALSVAALQPASQVRPSAPAPGPEYLTQSVNQPKPAPQLALPTTSVFAPPANEPRLPSVVALAPPAAKAPSSNAATKAAQPPRELALPKLDQEPPPKVAKPAVAPRPAAQAPAAPKLPKGVMTPGEIARIKGSLRLTSEQEPLWRPVEAVLRDIGRQQMAQIRSGVEPTVDQSAMHRLYGAGQPLLATLRPEQKEQIRRLARSMGYSSVASML